MNPAVQEPQALHNLWCVEKTPEPCAIVIFGASGDLTERKLIPALYSLYGQRLLAHPFFLIGFGRTPMSDTDFRDKMLKVLTPVAQNGERSPKEFVRSFYYVSGDYNDRASYKNLAGTLEKLEKTHGTLGNRVFYLSTPPSLYPAILEHIGESGMARQGISSAQWARLIIEKPFGHDLASATALSQEIKKYFSEKQVYRMDHYLGKETVQNILVFRFANSIFEPIWKRAYIDHVQITAAETLGVGTRAGYYDDAGCLRDMFQNHIFQLMCLVAMEAPASFDADRVRDEKAKVLYALRPVKEKEIDSTFVRSQYGPGEGNWGKGYLEEPNVKPDSKTETYVAAKVFIDNWRWQDVPFYLRAGKKMPRRVTEIAVQFRQVPHLLFGSMAREALCPNRLVLRIQPDEGIMLSFEAKAPGPEVILATVPMNFSYSESFKARPPEAYERLFLDGMLGDQTLFAREDWQTLSWSYLTPILKHWSQSPQKPFAYPAGSWGPREADQLIESDDRRWHQA